MGDSFIHNRHALTLRALHGLVENFFARWFIKSYTKDMLFKIRIPLMILPCKV